MAYADPGRDDNCTSTLAAEAFPCAACLNKDELEGLIIFLLQEALDEDHDVEDAIEDANCYTCFSDTQLLEAIVKVLISNYGNIEDLQDATDAVKCWKCAQPKQRRAVIVRLFCRFIAYINLPQ